MEGEEHESSHRRLKQLDSGFEGQKKRAAALDVSLPFFQLLWTKPLLRNFEMIFFFY